MSCCMFSAGEEGWLKHSRFSLHATVFYRPSSLVFRCADAAFLPAAQADSSRSPAAPDLLEIIRSSQGSPIINSPKLASAQPVDPKKPGDPDGNCTTATPASMVTSTSFLSIYFDAGIEDFHLKKKINFKKLIMFWLVCRFAPFCSKLCLQTLTVRLPQLVFWHAVVMKRRAWRKTSEALDSNVTTRYLKILFNVQNTDLKSVNGSKVTIGLRDQRYFTEAIYRLYKVIYSGRFYVTYRGHKVFWSMLVFPTRLLMLTSC